MLKEIQARLSFLVDVGLDYLSLDRPAATLAGGEAQRIRLATQIGSGLVGVLYVLDEPSIGLHQRDNTRLIETLIRLRDMGNTLIVVEHDEDTIKVADWIVDIGPGAGEHGGEIVVSGHLEDLMKSERSLTGAYLSGRMQIEIPKERREPTPGRELVVKGAREHNLKGVDVTFPLGCFVGVRGVRVGQVQPGQRHPLHDAGQPAEPRGWCRPAPDGHRARAPGQGRARRPVADRPHPAVEPGHLHRCLGPRPQAVRQPRRRCAGTCRPLLVQRQGRRCEACSGDGTLKIEMNFLPDVYVPCEVCNGARFNRETLEVHYKGKTVAEVLDMPIEEAPDFAAIPAISRYLRTLTEVGLGYVRLGQPAHALRR